MQMPSASYSLPLTYLPVTWLSYLPAHLLDIDLRWTNVAADTVSVILLWLGIDRSTRNTSWLPLLCISVLFLNPYFAYRMDAEISIFGMMLSLFLYTLATARFLLLGIVTGIMLATMQLALVVVPFAFVHMLAHTTLLQSARSVALALIVATLLITP